MANSPANTNRLYDGGIQFLLGVNSNLDPSALNSAQTSWQINTTNKGGIIETRPGFETRFRLPDGNAQGLTIFTPTGGHLTLVMAVSGKIYASVFPFTTYFRIPNIQFEPHVDHVTFKQTIQGTDGTIVIDPKAILVMQDGVTRPAYWDGSVSRHLDPSVNETPIGLWMEWIGNRLWVARGRQLFASDIFNPLLFTENLYLATGGSLNAMDGDVITALARTADAQSLLVFTIHNTTIVAAGITDRSTWKSTPNFITLLFPGVGASSGKSPFYLGGDLWWWSVEGARRFQQVGATIRSSGNSISSIEMRRSFDNLSTSVQNKVCGWSFGTFLGYSIPSGDVFNRHTWVLDTSTNNQLTSSSPFAWEGIWMGTRPVEWATANVNGTERCFFISQDYCGVRLWEAFKKDQTDNGGRIFSSVEFPGLLFSEQTAFKRFLYSEYHLNHLSGNVNITADYRTEWGCWKRIADVDLCAQDCFKTVNCNSPNPTIISQNRYFKTQEALHVCASKEGYLSEDYGTFIQNRIRWYGKNAIRKYKSTAQQFQENSTGACAKSDLACREVACCDPEIEYKSHVNDCSYGYGTSNSNCCII